MTQNKDCMQLAERFARFYTQLSPQSLTRLTDLYRDDIHFIDPFNDHMGLDALRHNFSKGLAGVTRCQFQLQQQRWHPDEAQLTWEMTLHHPKLNGNRPFCVSGCSWLKLANDKIYYHQDFYDAGALLYERIPVFGALTRRIKQALQL